MDKLLFDQLMIVLCIAGPVAGVLIVLAAVVIWRFCCRNKNRKYIEPIQNEQSIDASNNQLQDTPPFNTTLSNDSTSEPEVVPDVEITYANETTDDNFRRLRSNRNNRDEFGETNDNESKYVKKVLKVRPTCDNGYKIVSTPNSLYGDHILPVDEFNQENAIKLSEKRRQTRWMSENTVFEDPNAFIECYIVGKSLIKSREDNQNIVFLVSSRKVKTIQCYRSNSSQSQKWSESEDCGENWAIFKKNRFHYERRCLEYDEVEFSKET